jgi:alkanesulfonate monooxygenase SsuD/methylene tetrahydromethanopterin reductase-like flavin-dependent oxidoreductase (luciferase family)
MGYGFALFAGIATDVVTASAREAERLGFTSFWVNHPGTTDGLATLGAAAKATTRITLGIGVIPLHTRGPDSIAEGVRANTLGADRLLLGVGSPNPAALRRVRAGVADLRSRLPGVRLVVAALGPGMCRLAGEIADGVLFNWLTPEYAKTAGSWVRAGAETARRPAPTLCAYVRVALGAAAEKRLGDEAARYAAIPAYAAHFERMGVKPADTAIAGATPQAVAAGLRRWQGLLDEIVVRAITARDTIEDNLALLAAAKP